MEALLQHPAAQAGVVPFAVALAMGLSFEALTAIRKLVLIALATPVLVVALEAGGESRRRQQRGVVAGLYAAAAVWMLWRLLGAMDMGRAAVAAVAAGFYVSFLVGSTLHTSNDPIRGAAAGLLLGLGTGALAVLAASAVLGFASIAADAAAGATLLMQMLRGRPAPTGFTIPLPAAVTATNSPPARVLMDTLTITQTTLCRRMSQSLSAENFCRLNS